MKGAREWEVIEREREKRKVGIGKLTKRRLHKGGELESER